LAQEGRGCENLRSEDPFKVWSPKSLAAEKPEGIVVKSQWPTPSPS